MLLPKWKSDSGSESGFSQIFDSGGGSGPKEKRRILLESTPNPWPPLLGSITHKQSAAQNYLPRSEVLGVTFSDSDSSPVPKFLNPGPDPGPVILQI